MTDTKLQDLREAMKPFLRRRNGVAISAVVVDFAIYLGAVVVAVVAESLWLKTFSSIAAGTMISTLFVLGHDAAHGSLTTRRWLNQAIARLVFLPSLHNYTLWQIQHNRAHHHYPNVRELNSWWPRSTEEFRAMSMWKRGVEHVYRGGGFGVYYLIERWWRDKFIPLNTLDLGLRRSAWRDFGLLAVWLCCFLLAICWLGDQTGMSIPASVLWGFVVPFAVWNCSMGLTVFLQHTHPAVPWFRSVRDANEHGGQEERTINVTFPRWYGLLSHDIMEHPAHHINPMIPYYNLHKAQLRLNEVLGRDAIVERIGLRYIWSLMCTCKLYDYQRREWLDFSGRPTGQTHAALMYTRERS